MISLKDQMQKNNIKKHNYLLKTMELEFISF